MFGVDKYPETTGLAIQPIWVPLTASAWFMQVELVPRRSMRKEEANALRYFYLENKRQRRHGHG